MDGLIGGFTSPLECYCGEVMGDDGDLNEAATCLVCIAEAAIRKAIKAELNGAESKT